MLKNMRIGRTLAPIALSVFMLGAAFFMGIASGLAGTASHLYISLIAFTAVISSEVHGLKGHPYEGYDAVKSSLTKSIYGTVGNDEDLYVRTFRDTAVLNTGLREASTVNTCGSGLVMHPENDQGMIDFTRGAFRLFGIDVTSLYYFFFLLVGVSALLFVCSQWRSYSACVLLFACLCAIYAFMPGVVYADPQLISLANSRFLSTLAIIPLFHILLFLARPDSHIRWQDLIALVGQTALLAFAYAIRNSTIWMTATVGLVFAALLARPALQAWRTRSPALPAQAMARCAVMMVFAATLFGISGFRSIYLTPPCTAALNSHPIWHNIFIGLSHSGPEWRHGFGADYDNAEGDDLSFVAAKKYAIAHHLPYQTEPTIWVRTQQTQSMTIEAMPFGSWLVYEKVLRAAFFEFALRHPGYVLKNFLFYKPLLFVLALEDMLSRMWNDLTWPMIAIAAIMFALLAGLQGRRWREADAIGFPFIAALVLVSFIMSASPSLVVYSEHFLIADQAYVAVALTIFCSVWVLGSILAWISPSSSATRPECVIPWRTSS
jgi:hypothetical protein